MEPATRDDLGGGGDWFGRVFAFWIGDVEMTPTRRACLETIHETRCTLHLVTDATLPSFILDSHPLHEAYPFLSPIHRSDYLRAYFMHHFGGGYTDVKRTTQSWLPAFEAIRAQGMLGGGYQEVPRGTGRFHKSRVGGKYYHLEDSVPWPRAYLLYKLQAFQYKRLIGNGAFIFRPGSEFTGRWLAIAERRLSLLLPLLRENPARHPRDAPGKDHGDGPSRYPVPWSFLLGDILGPLGLAYRKRILQVVPPPDFRNYQ